MTENSLLQVNFTNALSCYVLATHWADKGGHKLNILPCSTPKLCIYITFHDYMQFSFRLKRLHQPQCANTNCFSNVCTYYNAFSCTTKGQLISKANFKVSICTKKPKKIFLYFCPSHYKWSNQENIR